MGFFPKRKLVVSPERAFVNAGYLLIWAIEGGFHYYISRPGIRLTSKELGRGIVARQGLIDVSPPKNALSIRPFPSYEHGNDASFSVDFGEFAFSPTRCLEGTPVELSIVEDGNDLADRVVILGGLAQDVGWATNGCIVSGTIHQDANLDSGVMPRRKVTAETWPASRNGWRNKFYPLLFGSGKITRSECVAARLVDSPSPELLSYVVCDGWLPELEATTLEYLDEDSKLLAPVPFQACWIRRQLDAAGNQVTLAEINISEVTGIKPNGSTRVFATLEWDPRPGDTVGGAIEQVLGDYAQLAVPVELGLGQQLDAVVGDVAFELQINEKVKPLELLADRLLKQVQGTITWDRHVLSLWALPRELGRGGTHLRMGAEIVDMTAPPAHTSLDDVVNTWNIEWGRDPLDPSKTLRSAGANARYDAIAERPGSLFRIYGVADEPAVKDLAMLPDPIASQSSRLEFGPRPIDLSCPDLTGQPDVEAIAERIARWFSTPKWRLTYRLIPQCLHLRVGELVVVSDAKWGFDKAPFLVESIVPDITGPVVELWGGNEI